MAAKEQNELPIQKNHRPFLDYQATPRLKWWKGWSKAGWVSLVAGVLWFPWLYVSGLCLWLYFGDNSTPPDNIFYPIISLPGIVAFIFGAYSLKTHGLTRNLPGVIGFIISLIPIFGIAYWVLVK
jgi:hypothetical protein